MSSLGRLALMVALVAVVPVHAAAQISNTDRDALLRDLERSRTILLEAIADVQTEAQWNYKPAPDRWSVGECVAHIIASEDFLRQTALAALKSPPLPADQVDRDRDAVVVKAIRDRSQRFQAPDVLEPTGKVVPKAQAIVEFEAARARTLEYVRATQDALHEHGTGVPPNVMSAYQLLLMLSGHTERHTAQLLEVKASPGYPGR